MFIQQYPAEPIIHCVDENGCFTKTCGIPSVTGLSVLGEGNSRILELLSNLKLLLRQDKFIHKYPYDWRSKLPVIYNLSKQWFMNLVALKKDIVNGVENVKFYSEKGLKK